MGSGRGRSSGDRRAAIREVLAGEVVRTQTDLLDRLQGRGFRVTQSSVSRDLADLRAARIDGRYTTADALARGAVSAVEPTEMSVSVRAVRAAGPNLLVVLTPPGRAGAVGLAIDGMRWPEVAGTVAGDDTVFVATKGRREQAVVEARLSRTKRGRP